MARYSFGGLSDDLYELVDRATNELQEQTQDEFLMFPVDSSNIKEVGYNYEREVLRIEFLNGGVYDYFNVPSIEFNGLRSADSKGKYLHKNIKGNYRFKKVRS
jgi:hypothetical protein